MLKTLLFFLFLFPSLIFAQDFQSSLIFSSDQGDAFTVYLNGKQQNPGPQSKVTIHGLELPYYDVRIVFQGSSIQPLERKNVSAADSDDRPMQVTYKVRREKSGKSKLSFYAMLPPVSVKSPDVAEVVEVKADKVIKGPEEPSVKAILSNVSGATVSLPKTDSVVRNTKISSALDEPQDVQPVPAVENKPATPRTVPVASTKKAERVSPTVKNEKQIKSNPPPSSEVLPPLKKCNDWPMMKEEFQKIKLQVSEFREESSRLEKAKALSSSNCLLVSQVAEIAGLFVKEPARLQFVKHAYSFTIDRPNYNRLKKLFTETGSVREFEKFLQSR